MHFQTPASPHIVACLIACVFVTHAAGALQCASRSPCKLGCNTYCANTDAIFNPNGVTSRPRSPAAVPVNDEQSQVLNMKPSNAMRMDNIISRVTALSEQQALATIQSHRPDEYPAATLAATGEWFTVPPGHWVSGFFVGVLWQLHTLTGKKLWADAATTWQAALANHQRTWMSQHDFGFIYLPTFAHSYSVTGSREDLRQALAAAEALAWNYNPASKSLRTFEGWEPKQSTDNYKQIVIIDFMINIHMLVWGAKHVKQWGPWNGLMDQEPEKAWMEMAISHARQVAANHIRPDGSSYHVVEYHPDTGNVLARYTYQGYANNSTWARGQSWTIAGFSLLYNETGLPEFLDVARRVADRWLQLLVEQEGPAAGSYIPVWDFNAPFNEQNDGPRDTSAAAVAALGFLHLAEAMPNTECGEKYLCAAVNTMRALASPKYLASVDEPHAAILKHSTGNLPDKDKIDVGLIYGDYFLLKALHKCSTMEACRTYGL